MREFFYGLFVFVGLAGSIAVSAFVLFIFRFEDCTGSEVVTLFALSMAPVVAGAFLGHLTDTVCDMLRV